MSSASTVTEETKFFITERILNSDFAGIDGVLKHRSTDFVVEEVDPEGRVVEYSPDCLYLDQDLIPVNKKEAARGAAGETEPEPETQAENQARLLEELTGLFDDAEFAASVLALHATATSKTLTSSPTQLVHERSIEDKEHRTRIHHYFKCHFGGKLVTDVVAPGSHFRVSIRNRTSGAGRSTGYDHRNNQNPDGAKPVPFLQFSLYKDGMDTMEAIQTLARRLDTPPRAFSYAGTKDRRAVSIQRIVVRNTFPARIAGINKIPNLRMRVSHLQRAERQLQFGDLQGNRFSIILRNVQRFDQIERDRMAAAITTLATTGFINYFGLQRFGRGGDEASTDVIGRAMLAGDLRLACNLILDPRADETNQTIVAARTLWKETGDATRALAAFPSRCSAECAILRHFSKTGGTADVTGAIGSISRELRLMFVHAAQSLWWNEAASARIRQFGVTRVVVGDLVLPGGSEGCGEESEDVNGEENESVRESVSASTPTAPTASARTAPIVVTTENVHLFSIFDIVLPVVGYNTIFPEHEAGQEMRARIVATCPQVMERTGRAALWDLPGSYRHLLQRPRNLEAQHFFYSDADEPLPPAVTLNDGPLSAVRLRFVLPSSAYATMLLRELLPHDTSTAAAFQKTLSTRNPRSPAE